MDHQRIIGTLEKGEEVSFRPRGNSMTPIIQSGQLCTLSPDLDNLNKGDIVFCKVKGKYYLHKITGIKSNSYLISNNKGHVNGWANIKNIYGKLINIE